LATAFRFAIGPYFLVALTGTVAGLLFGLSLMWPTGWDGYRWERTLVVGVVPLALVVVYLVLYGSEAGFQALPDPLVRLLVSQFTQAGLLISAPLLGVAVAAGFAEPRRARSDRGGDVGPKLGPPGAQL
jgi:hypothetical protein